MGGGDCGYAIDQGTTIQQKLVDERNGNILATAFHTNTDAGQAGALPRFENFQIGWNICVEIDMPHELPVICSFAEFFRLVELDV